MSYTVIFLTAICNFTMLDVTIRYIHVQLCMTCAITSLAISRVSRLSLKLWASFRKGWPNLLYFVKGGDCLTGIKFCPYRPVTCACKSVYYMIVHNCICTVSMLFCSRCGPCAGIRTASSWWRLTTTEVSVFGAWKTITNRRVCSRLTVSEEHTCKISSRSTYLK